VLLGVAASGCAHLGARTTAGGPGIRVLLADRVESVEVDGRTIRQEQRRPAPGPHTVDGRRVRGSVEVSRGPGGLRVVNELPLEDYVAGTVLGEVAESWGASLLRAQAVAIRTYALHRRAEAGSRGYDVEADTRAQVYLGLDGETDAVRDAVAATRGQVLTYEGAPILAAFSSSAGGRTASAAEVWGHDVPYLRSVPVTGEEDSPDTYWRVRFTADELRLALLALGDDVGALRDVAVVERSPSGRAVAIRVSASRGDVALPAEALRRALGAARLPSTLFEIRRAGDDFVFVGSGRGHGVGMSQWGARALANEGASYTQILATFYPGARLERVGALQRSAPVGAAP
jgi:stage II sporulation protein D